LQRGLQFNSGIICKAAPPDAPKGRNQMKKILFATALGGLMATSAMAETVGVSMARFDDNFLTVLRNGMIAMADDMDGVDIQVEDAQNDVAKQLDQINNSILKAQDIVTELMVSLDFEKGGEIAPKLFGLYRYFNDQLMEANINKNPEPLSVVRRLMGELRDAWSQILGKTNVEGTATGGVNIAG
jgi:flagellar biosynthetic protein FliS